MTSCQTCRARTELYLCADCCDTLDEALATLPELLRELDITIARRDKLSTGTIGHTTLVSAPINFGAAHLLEELTDTLTDIIDDLCAANHVQFLPALTMPTGFIGPLRPGWKRAPAGYSGSPRQRAAWLRHHLRLIAAHRTAADIFDRITDYTGDRNHPSKTGRLWQMIGHHHRIFAGFCPQVIGRDAIGEPVECGTTLYADEDATDLTCPICSATVNVARNRQRAIMSRDLLPEARILSVMADLGENVCKERLQKWLASGRLTPRGFLHGCQIVEHRLSRRDARLLSLSRVRQLRWAELS